MEKFAIGMLIGVGALATANSYKMRTLVKKGQEEAQTKFNEILDEKLEQLEEGAEKLKKKAESVKDKAEKKLKKAFKSKESSAKENG